MSVTIGIDLGSIAAKALLHDPQRGVLGVAKSFYTHQGVSNITDLDPEQVIRALERAVAEVLRESAVAPCEVVALGLSTIMHSVVFVDRSGNPLTPVQTYADTRGAETVAQLTQHQRRDIHARTGCIAHPSYALWNLIWHKHHCPDIMRQTRWVLGLSEYVFFRLTDTVYASQSVSSTLGYLNIHTLDWDDDLLNEAGVRRDQLAPLHPPEDGAPLSSAAAARLGLKMIPVVLGSGDGMNTHIGTGALQTGMMTSTVGTTGAVRMIQSAPSTDDPALWCYYLAEQRYVLGCAITSGGNCLEWMREKILEVPSTDEFFDTINSRLTLELLDNHLTDGPFVIPFLYGERGPGWHDQAQAMIFNLSGKHGRADLWLAFMEGVLFNLYQCYEILVQRTGLPLEIRVTGGITNAPVWMQMKSDLYNQPLYVPDGREPVAVAAAQFAQLHVGLIESLDGCKVSLSKCYEPNLDTHRRFQQRYAYYRELYDQQLLKR